MAIIYSYPLQTTIDSTDLLTGTKKNATSPSQNPTVCWTMGTLSTFVKDDILGYNAYTSILSQSGVVAPTDVVLKNNTGATMVWTYTGVGAYTITASGPIFTLNKTLIFWNTGGVDDRQITWTRVSTSQITITAADLAGNPDDNSFGNGAFEIRIYS